MRRVLAPPPDVPVSRGKPLTSSAIVAAHQAAEIIADAIDSLLAQPLPPTEIIVCERTTATASATIHTSVRSSRSSEVSSSARTATSRLQRARRTPFGPAPLEVGPGEYEVIVPANTHIARALAASEVGGDVVLVDCDAATYNIDPQLVEAAVRARPALTSEQIGVVTGAIREFFPGRQD
jgi:DegT/DnrJ/EryC1/StrS aminotransferase family